MIIFIWYLMTKLLYAKNCSCEHSLGIIRDMAVDVISSAIINNRCEWVSINTFQDIKTKKKFKLKDMYNIMPYIYKNNKNYRCDYDRKYALVLRDKYMEAIKII